MGRTLAIFQSSGYIPIERERLKMADKDGDKISAAIFKLIWNIVMASGFIGINGF